MNEDEHFQAIRTLITERSEAERARAHLYAEIEKAAEELGTFAALLKNNKQKAFQVLERGGLSNYTDLAKLEEMLADCLSLSRKIAECTAKLNAAGMGQ